VFDLSVMGVSCAEMYMCVCVCVYLQEELTLLEAVSAKCLNKLHIFVK
jgi:hypothetical protein